MGRNFLNRNKVVKVADHTVAGTSAVVSSIVDTAGYSGVIFMTSVSTANATNSIKVSQNTANQTTGMADLVGSSVASGTTDEDLIVEIHKPLERYLQAEVTRGSSTTCESIWAILYNGDVSVATSTLAGTQIAELHVQPAEGTA